MVNKLMNETDNNNNNENNCIESAQVEQNEDSPVPPPDESNTPDIPKTNLYKELWRVGVICKKDCFFLTQEILKILEKIGFEWKIASSSYKIKCRRRKEDPKNPNNYSKTNPLIVQIKIYGNIDKDTKDEFLVDLHKKSGFIMEFLEFSSNLVSSLQKEGLVVFK